MLSQLDKFGSSDQRMNNNFESGVAQYHFSLANSVRLPPFGNALAAFDLRCSPRKGPAIPFGLRLAQTQQERSASEISKSTEH